MEFRKFRRSSALVSVVIILAMTLACLHGNDISATSLEEHRLMFSIDPATAQIGTVRNYTIDDIILTVSYVEPSHPQLLVWDGHHFSTYDMLSHRNETHLSSRNGISIPLLVHALRDNFPDRFKPGTPPFQLLWSGDDSIGGRCINENNDCPTHNFAPVLMFGSVPKNESLMPNVKAFPNTYYTRCLYSYRIFAHRECEWKKVNDDLQWDQLKRQVFWRGSDFSNYLVDYQPAYRTKGALVNDIVTPDVVKKLSREQIVALLFDNQYDIPPRWIALAYTIMTQLQGKNDEAWINVLFSNKGSFNHEIHQSLEDKGLQVTDDPVDPYLMSKYRYQIDLAGGGGTTWDGTITKLLMPGVLFHHETPFKDWFYDEMIPWIHYIPVKADLSDLFERYQWAETNDSRVISERATKFAKYLLSEEYMRKTYESLYVDYLGKVVHAYDAQGMDWPAMIEEYAQRGIRLYQVATCDDKNCKTQVAEQEHIEYSNVAFIKL